MRFYQERDGTGFKNNSKVAITEVIDLNNYSIRKDESVGLYYLTGFIKHDSDALNSRYAHYYAIVRGPNDTWIELNDSKVSRITRDQMLKEAQDGCIFLYHQKE